MASNKGCTGTHFCEESCLDGAECNFNCLLKYVSDADTDSTDQDLSQSCDLVDDNMYQVLGKDVLRSSLIDDIDLYLECDDDNLYTVPDQVKNKNSAHENSVRISVPYPTKVVDKPQRYICNKCKKSFTRTSLLKDHQARQHGVKNLFTCPLCNYKGQLYRHLQKHIKRQHSQFDWKQFVKCIKSSSRNLKEKQHESSVSSTNISNSGNVNCCNTTHNSEGPSNSSGPLKSAVVTSTVLSEGNSVEVLKTTNSTTDDVNLTLSNIDNGKCDYGDVHSRLLSTTSEDSSSSSLLDCIALEFTVQTEPTSASANRSSNDALLQCEKCLKTFKQKRSYVSHIKQHAGELDFKCETCSKQFVSAAILLSHCRSHSNARSHQCDQTGCQKIFKTISALNQHRTVVHGTKKFSCTHSGCKKSFAMEKDLRAHLKAHMVLFSCIWEGCDKKFRDNYNLQCHLKKHTGVRDLACPHCTYMCAQKTSLNYHIRKCHAALLKH